LGRKGLCNAKIVTSATIGSRRRSRRKLAQRDPENRLLARGPRQRLSAETIRDAALSASGLLVGQIGGSSVKPYQPPRLWLELTGKEDYDQGHGDDCTGAVSTPSSSGRWRANNGHLSTQSPRETCTVRITRTNTPLQALALMNDVTFVERRAY